MFVTVAVQLEVCVIVIVAAAHFTLIPASYGRHGKDNGTV